MARLRTHWHIILIVQVCDTGWLAVMHTYLPTCILRKCLIKQMHYSWWYDKIGRWKKKKRKRRSTYTQACPTWRSVIASDHFLPDESSSGDEPAKTYLGTVRRTVSDYYPTCAPAPRATHSWPITPSTGVRKLSRCFGPGYGYPERRKYRLSSLSSQILTLRTRLRVPLDWPEARVHGSKAFPLCTRHRTMLKSTKVTGSRRISLWETLRKFRSSVESAFFFFFLLTQFFKKHINKNIKCHVVDRILRGRGKNLPGSVAQS